MVKKFLSMVCVICVSVLCLSTVLGSQVLLNSQDAAADVNLGEILLDVGDNIVSTIPDTIISTMLPGVAPVVTGVNVIGDVVNLIDESGGGEILIDDSGSSGSSGGHSFGGGSTTAGDILPSAGVSGTTSGGGSDGGSSSGESFDCDKLLRENPQIGSIGAMQWILCPSLNNTIYTADMMDKITEGMLSVDSEMYNSSSYTANAWGIIRNIANVLMIVFLMVIIISQLTGRGIDNYGIKKMLPRLIVMAIIVNLSLYICQIAVDLSNILGVGLRDLIGSAANVAQENGAVRAENPASDAAMGLFAIAGTGGTAAVGAGTFAFGTLGIAAAPAVAIGAIVLVLVVLVAIVILFLMLGARMAIVIACIILSPLAFAAFILPNTQNLFKKWWELFKAALVIFPLCGAVSGIAYMLRQMKNNMTFDTSTAGFYVILFILPYVGFFFLPMLLKNAISALGKLGGALTNAGNMIRNGGRAIGQGAMRVANNTERYKDMQQEAARRRQEMRANRITSRYNSDDNARRLEDAKRRLEANPNDRAARRDYERAQNEQRRAARASETLRKLDNENQAARTILTEKEYAGRSLDDLMNDWNQAFDGGDTDKMNALTNVIVSRHGPGGVSQIASSMADKKVFEQNLVNGQVVADEAHKDGMRFVGGDNGAMAKSFTALQANMLQNSALANAMQNKASDVFQMVSGGGYVNGKRQNVAAHAKDNGISTQMKDWVTQSNGTLKRAAENGGLTQQMARDILNSTDPAIQSGIQSDKDKRATLEAIAGGYVNRSWGDTQAVNQVASRYRATSAGLVSGSYANMSAADVYAEAQNENIQRQGGMAPEYINRSANGVASEAWAENERRNQEQARNAGQQQTGQTGQQQQTAQPTPQPIPQPMPQPTPQPVQQTTQPMPQSTPQPAQQTGQPAPQPVQQTGQPTLPSQPPAVIIPPINPPASTASNQNSGQQNNFGNNIAEALRNNANSTADVANGLKNLRGAIESDNNSQVFEVRNTGGEPTGQIVNNQNIVNNTNNTTTNENNNLSAQFDASLRGLETNRFERIIPRGNNRRDNKSNNNNSNPDDNPSSNGESDS